MTHPSLPRIEDEIVDPLTDGFGGLETERGHLPLTALDVHAEITGLVATTRLTQTFVNTYEEPLEATYTFPLPPRAAVSSFTLTVAGRTVRGDLKERREARRTYDEAMASGHRAAIVEEERPDVFTMRVGNLPAGERAEVTLEMTAPLEMIAQTAEWRFPLTVAPRYIPGTPLDDADVGAGTASDTDAVPDASRITPPTRLPNYPNPVELGVEVSIDTAGLPMKNLRATLHAVTVERSEHRAHIRLDPGERVDRDFILRFDLGDHRVCSSAVCATSDTEAERAGNILQCTLVPPVRDAPTRPRDVFFILDRSGSMDGWKMIAARRAIGRMLDTLSPRDRFQVLAFDNSSEALPETSPSDLVEATNLRRWRALEHISTIEARGGTEMVGPLTTAAQALQGGNEDRQRQIVLVTDGQVGHEDQILATLEPMLGSTHVFTVGIDRAVNAGFLRRLADVGHGVCRLVESEERLDEVMDHIHRAIDTPVLKELSVAIDGAEATLSAQVPGRIAALFEGAPLIVSAVVDGDLPDDAHLQIRGVDALGDAFERRIPIARTDSVAIERQWARGRIRQLEDRWAVGRGDLSSLQSEIVRISLAHDVLSRFTAFVAVDEADIIDNPEHRREVTQPVESPQGWEMSAPMPQASAAPSAQRSRSGMPTGGDGHLLMGHISTDAFSGMDTEQAMRGPQAPRAVSPSSAGDGAPKRKKREEVGAEASDSFGRVRSMFEQLEDADDHAEGAAPTSPYTSPEQLSGDGLHATTDVWGVALILYRMITGEDLHWRTKGEGFPEDPAPFEQLLGEMLDPDPDARPTLEQVIARLDAHIDDPEAARSRLASQCAQARASKTGALAASDVNLTKLLAAQELAPREAAWVAREIARVCMKGQKDKTRGIHGHLAPDHVLLTQDGQVRLPDAFWRGAAGEASSGGLVDRVRNFFKSWR